MTQKESVLQLLNQAEWVCGREFLANYLQEYRTRINELRKDGFTVEARRCTQHQHKAGMQEWSLVQKAHQTPQNAPGTTEQSRTQNYIRPANMPLPEPGKTARGGTFNLPKGNYAYYPPSEPEFCCLIAKASNGRMHSRNCGGL